MVTLPTIMVSRTHKFCSYLLHVLLILYQVQTSLEETFTNETSTNINSAEQVSFYGTTEVIPFTINTTAETGGASHPEPSVYNASSDPDLSFSTGGENPVITNTTADPGGASYPETSVYNASAGPDLFLPTREELPGIGNATAETIGAFHPDPSMYTASAGPDLSFPTEKKNPVTTNPTTETGGVSHPESDNSTELGSLYPTGGGITVTTSPMEETTGGASHPARTFPARLAISAFHSTDGTIRGDGQLETTISREVTKLFGAVFGNVWGYLSTSVTVLQPSEGHMTIVHSFSMLHEITEEDLREELTVSALRCEEGNGSCISLLATDVYQSLSLCDFALCDSSSSDCQSHAGLVTCKCQNGYFKFDPSDRSCRACESGFWRTEGQCQRCPLGYGGFNCQEAFLLVVIALSCVVSVLLVSLVTVLFYYFRKKKKPKPTFMDSLVLGVSTDQPVLRLPRAQFSWRREWEWTDQSGKILEDLHREGTVLNQNSEPSDIQMRTFGSISRTSVPNFNRGSHNLAFISDN
ncbi:uncharacterized protein [Aquarana catesbeiana]|uniref:uncharacterized protein isoform X8 n=1 Tax=Aquarana catesbeiana TaxID=8400 RepID=UPI003CC9F58D